MKLINAPSFVRQAQLAVVENQVFVNGLLVDPDAEFIRANTDTKTNAFIDAFSHTYVIDVTTHCNMSCKYCYYKVDNTTADRSIQSVVDEAIASGFKAICLMGAEPTMRVDLIDMICTLSEAGFRVGITTNGKKLEDKGYLEALKAAGLVALNYSMHFENSYKVGRRKAKVLKNILDVGVPISQLSFTISSLDEMRSVMDMLGYLKELGVRPEQFVIRAGAGIGDCQIDSGLFMSDMAKLVMLEYACPKMKDGGSNLYFQEFMFGETNLHLVRWPTNVTVTPYSLTGPTFGTALGPMLSPVCQVVQALGAEQLNNERALLLDNKRVIHEVVRDFVTLRAVETVLMPNRLWIHCDITSWGLKEARESKHIWPAFQEIIRQKGYDEIYSCVPAEDALLLKWQTSHGMQEISRVQGQIIFRKELNHG